MAIDAETLQKIQAWNTAIALLDETEVKVRDLIERELVNVAGVNNTRYGDAMKAADKLIEQISRIRTTTFKRAFRHVRDAYDV
jgi:hypothetical protein